MNKEFTKSVGLCKEGVVLMHGDSIDDVDDIVFESFRVYFNGVDRNTLRMHRLQQTNPLFFTINIRLDESTNDVDWGFNIWTV